MQKAFDLIKERLKEKSVETIPTCAVDGYSMTEEEKMVFTDEAVKIVNQVAEEYKDFEIFTKEQLANIEQMNVDTFERLVKINKSNDGWIPCSERLPEESLNSVIGWDEYRERCCFVQYYGGRWVLGNDIESVKIIAWQPLPPAYQPKGE